MNTLIASLVLFLTSLPALAAAARAQDAAGVIVSPRWVHERLADPRLVLLHVGDRREYDSLHLPGARYIHAREFAVPHVEGALSLQIPNAARADSLLEARGVTDSSIIVVYPGKDWLTPTARVWLTLEHFGLGARSHVMDGGMGAWTGAGFPVTAETTAAAAGNVTLRPGSDNIATKEWIRERLGDPTVALLDARDTNFYAGRDTGVASKPGRIPGARSLPYYSFVDSLNRFLPADSLRVLFAGAGMTPEKTAVSYCHIGQQASLVYLMARVLGYRAKMYDGSMQEWTRDPDAPVAAGPEGSEVVPKDKK